MIIVKLNTYKTMAIFNVNQNRQFYVVTEEFTGEDFKEMTEGQVKITEVPRSKEDQTTVQVAFQHLGKGGLTRTDLIDLDKVCYANITEPDALAIPLKKAVVELNPDVNGTKPVQGEDYVLRIQINNYLAPGDASVYIKAAAVHVTKAMAETPSILFEKLAEVLEKSFSREEQTMLKFEAKGETLEITELDDSPYRLGVLSKQGLNFEVYPSIINDEGDEVVWAKVNPKTNKIDLVDSGETISGSYKLADLEYFCSAERGDMFRNMGYPNNIDVQMMVDTTKEYYVLDIHYYFSGAGVQVHKSEKDLTFVSESKEVLEKIKAAVMPED